MKEASTKTTDIPLVYTEICMYAWLCVTTIVYIQQFIHILHNSKADILATLPSKTSSGDPWHAAAYIPSTLEPTFLCRSDGRQPDGLIINCSLEKWALPRVGCYMPRNVCPAITHCTSHKGGRSCCFCCRVEEEG